MHTIALVLAFLVAALHVWFLVLEMFLWEKPIGLKTFRNSPEDARRMAVLAKNQGLYNGFLAAGLLWGAGVVLQGGAHGGAVLHFFFGCVVIAGAYGAATVSPRIFFIQALPALLGFVAISLA